MFCIYMIKCFVKCSFDIKPTLQILSMVVFYYCLENNSSAKYKFSQVRTIAVNNFQRNLSDEN